MRYWLYAVCKRTFIQPFLLISLILIIALPLMLGIQLKEDSHIIHVIVVNESSSETGAELYEKLLSKSSGLILFDGIDDDYFKKNTEKIMSSAEAVYIIPKDIDERIADFHTKRNGIITAVRSEDELSVRIIDEMVYGALYDYIAEDMALRYVEKYVEISDGDISGASEADEFHDKYESYRAAEVPFIFEHADGSAFYELNEDTGDKNPLLSPVKGLIAVLIVLAALTGGILWYEDRDRSVFIRLTPGRRHLVHVMYILATALPASVTGLVGVFAAGAETDSFFHESIAMAALFLMIVPLVFLIQLLIKDRRIYMALIPALTIYNLFCGSVFAELDGVGALQPLRLCNPLYYYMQI
ncbi:MAG: hypothetical protein J6P16_05085 [Eubacterium sp.]|nr:hypothetical protein [Eubacterium sp.]